MKPIYFLYALLLFMAYWIDMLYRPFMQNIVISALLAIATHNVYAYFIYKTNRRILSATLSTLLAAFAVFLPILYLITTLTSSLETMQTSDLKVFINQIAEWTKSLPEIFPEVIPPPDKIAEEIKNADIIEKTLGVLADFGKVGAIFFKDLFMILVFYFFSLLYGKEMLNFLAQLIPLPDESVMELFSEISSVMSVVFYSIFTVAVLEGILFGIIVAVFDYDGILLGILYGLSSLIPIVGGIIMWIPVCGYELYHGSTTNALIILIYSLIVISFLADTIIKPLIITYINKKIVQFPAHINELLIFFAIIAGLATFGFWGMILGPAITTLFISLLRLTGKMTKAEQQAETDLP